tara:strand:+ start:1435 stop:2493 length:1059 start_codon:yes stop_codon:yes gene_type:complete
MHSNLRILYVLMLITAVTGGVWLYTQPAGQLASIEGTDFAVTDTSLVDKIFIADMDGKSVTLARPDKGKLWGLNGRFKAREDAVTLLLKTFKRAAIQGPVAEAAEPNVVRLISARGKKVEIYQGGETPVKTWYVGTATPSHTGTYMVLETPQGRGDKPYVVHMEGFTGYLSTRFFTSERDWRFTGLFNHPKRSLAGIEVRHLDQDGESYLLTSEDDGALELRGLEGKPFAYRDTLGLRQHFLRFKRVHLETYDSRLSNAVEDSLRSASGAFELTTWNKLGDRSSVTVHWKREKDAASGSGGLDLEQLYGVTSEGEVVLLQRFVFDPLIRGLSELTIPQIAPVASAGLPMPTN